MDWKTVDSSNLSQITYDKQSMTLGIKFFNGSVYTYDDVGMQVFTDLQTASSVGGYFNKAIKASYPYMKHADAQEAEAYIMARREST